jgi:hypothetical protein
MTAERYTSLDPARIVATAASLRERISERFPQAGLGQVAEELLATCREAEALTDWLARPNRWLRAVVAAALVLLLVVLVEGILNFRVQMGFTNVSDFFQGLEAAVNNAVFVGIAVFFLFTWENRHKRRRALAALHTLRSLAHVIDMHQLTKDPARLMSAGAGADTSSSPRRTMTAFELTRYLDYCSELLSVISKVAALYVERFHDPVTLTAVDEVESLTSGLSRKIWQKIMILDR